MIDEREQPRGAVDTALALLRDQAGEWKPSPRTIALAQRLQAALARIPPKGDG